MRGPVRFIAAVLLSFSLGLHWAALQSVAWTSMLLTRTQQGGFVEALQTTFDGKHPCPICLVVREGRAAEGNPSSSPAPATTQAPKLDLTLASAPYQLIADAAVTWRPATDGATFDSRSDPPLRRPPRPA